MKIPSLLTKERIQKAIPPEDCSGRIYPDWEKEDITRYMILAAEIQRDYDIHFYTKAPKHWK